MQPFSGDEARLREALATALAYHHAKPQAGHLGGVSPNARFAAFVADCWTATALDPWELAVAFSHLFVKPVRAGGTRRLGGTVFRADALQAFVGRKLLVRQPLFGDREMLFVFTGHGEPLAVGRPDLAYASGDPAGAGEQARRVKALTRDMRALEAGAGPAAGVASRPCPMWSRCSGERRARSAPTP